MYESRNGRMYRTDADGSEQMANFEAWITEEIHYVDGITSESDLVIEGKQIEVGEDNLDIERKLPPVRVKAEAFAGLAWVMPGWGVRCVISPGSSMKDDLRAAIQLRSRPKVRTIYKHLGWSDTARKFLHAGGGVGKAGNDPSITVQLPPELMRYDLRTKVEPKDGLIATLALATLGPPHVMYPLIAAALSPIYGPVDFAAHVTGRTGTYKSEVLSLLQCHYGATMDARHLPGSWSSTANALEAQAFAAKNCAFVLDDFIPSGTSWQVRAYQATADKIIRAQGNQAGRARLTDVSSLQTTMYPRGVILSSGEDTPEGHSVRARMMILELSPGDIEPAKLTQAQANRERYTATTVALIQALAATPPLPGQMKEELNEYRDKYQEIGHSRTPSMLARLVYTWEKILQVGMNLGLLTAQRYAKGIAAAIAGIEEAGGRQQYYLEDADPVDQFMAAIRSALASGGGHFRAISGGVPRGADILGWSSEKSNVEMDTYRSRGALMGWVDWPHDELLLEVDAGFAAVKKASAGEMTFTKQTMMKRLKDAGVLTRTDGTRQRNTVRITAEGHARTVLALSISTTLETKEVPQ